MKFYGFAFLLGLCSSFGVYSEIPLNDGRVQRAEFVSSLIKAGDVGAEIGVCAGVFAYYVLLPSQPSKLYLIDPWQYGLQADVEKDPTAEKQSHADSLYKKVFNLFSSYPNVEIIRLKSEDAVFMFPDEYFDYVYIDGEHSYKAVMRDLTNYFPKVKIGGYIIGDDYGWAGIMPAVQDFLKAHPELSLLDDPYAGRTGGQFAFRKIK